MLPRLLLVPLAVALIVLGFVQIAQGQAEQKLEMSLNVASADPVPGGDPVYIPFTVTHVCETLFGSGEKVKISVSTDATGVTATANSTEFTPPAATSCSAGEKIEYRENITVTVAADAPYLAGDQPEIVVNASAKDLAGRDFFVEQTTTVTIAPLVSVTYQTNETMFPAEQGELVSILIDIESTSNDEVTVTASFPDWNLSETAPEVNQTTLMPADDNGTAMGEIEILFEVPADAEPTTHTFTVQLEASPAGDREAVVTENLTYEITVVKKSKGDGDSKDSPGPAVPALVVFTALVAAALRRRE